MNADRDGFVRVIQILLSLMILLVGIDLYLRFTPEATAAHPAPTVSDGSR